MNNFTTVVEAIKWPAWPGFKPSHGRNQLPHTFKQETIGGRCGCSTQLKSRKQLTLSFSMAGTRTADTSPSFRLAERDARHGSALKAIAMSRLGHYLHISHQDEDEEGQKDN